MSTHRASCNNVCVGRSACTYTKWAATLASTRDASGNKGLRCAVYSCHANQLCCRAAHDATCKCNTACCFASSVLLFAHRCTLDERSSALNIPCVNTRPYAARDADVVAPIAMHKRVPLLAIAGQKCRS